ncbi:MAG TPA: FHA domain-containing protein [Mycobacteriales bacterium]|nr:FHA domain-containing protein [Mycobacteriales bacterium]
MSVRCPAGHPSEATDYCDVCGAKIEAGPAAGGAAAGAAAAPAAPPADPPTEAAVRCPHCQDLNVASALFCESCGYDFTTGQLPEVGAALLGRPAAPAPTTGWVAEIWVDPDWYAHEAVSATDPCPNTGTPRVVPLRTATSLIGRPSASRNLHPAIDCGTDAAVSRRHAEVTVEGDTAYIEDLQSVNGTYVGKSGAPLPDDPIPPGRRRALTEDERVYVGAWTRIVIRPATAEESGT